MRIEEQIRRTYLESGAALFYADEFVGAGTDHEQALDTLNSLVESGELNPVVQLKAATDNDDCLCWQGKPSDFAELEASHICEECGTEQSSEDSYTLVHFEVSQVWRQELEPQKKAAAPGPPVSTRGHRRGSRPTTSPTRWWRPRQLAKRLSARGWLG